MTDSSSSADTRAEIMWATPLTVAERPIHVEIGDLCLTIGRMKHEWQLSYHWEKKGSGGGFNCRFLEHLIGSAERVDRIAMETMTDGLSLMPRLADRPIVVRPYSPFTIPARNRITLYVTTPIWLSVKFAEQVIRDFPVQQLSDTWMGPKSHAGELCYGSHTHARLDQDMLLHLPFRALTPVTIHNKNGDDFTLERLSIPAPHLSIYDDGEQLITEPISITMDSATNRGIVNIGKVSAHAVISPPRKTAERGILVGALENLFAWTHGPDQ